MTEDVFSLSCLAPEVFSENGENKGFFHCLLNLSTMPTGYPSKIHANIVNQVSSTLFETSKGYPMGKLHKAAKNMIFPLYHRVFSARVDR